MGAQSSCHVRDRPRREKEEVVERVQILRKHFFLENLQVEPRKEHARLLGDILAMSHWP